MEERPMKESSTVVKLSTSNFGNLSIEKENIITFEQGLLGFEELKQFAIIAVEECLPFEWLVSLEDPMVAFPILNPTLFFSDYKPSLSKDDLVLLNIKKEKDVEMFCIVTLGKKPEDVTLNLKGPILINMKNKMGKQVVLTEDYYSLNQQLIRY
ncbi:MAG TPA: flagellar assembly protein FliW [Candidatus Wunengus sp. YC64]|uniref:flagellar assembly protein FliW n=1 Tax=Candidatus Wunengus sp. YC64 TaxID=3367700 RepID=UPI0040286E89